jgi:hypothetical protein
VSAARPYAVGDWITWCGPGFRRRGRIRAIWYNALDAPDGLGFDLEAVYVDGLVMTLAHTHRYLSECGCCRVDRRRIPELEMQLLVAAL